MGSTLLAKGAANMMDTLIDSGRNPDLKAAISDIPESMGLGGLTAPGVAPLLWRAERVGVLSAWWEHVPFAHWIVSVTAPRCLVELGTHTGVSYAAFCRAVDGASLGTRCYAIDTWTGDAHSEEYDETVFEDFRRFHDERFITFSSLLRCTFDQALENFADGSVDLLHIDGLHTYEAARHDFETWRPKLSDRAVVLFHDTNEYDRGFGVWRLWAELSEQYPAFEFLHGHGLGVLAVGGNVPPPIADLCAIEGHSEISSMRGLFARLGQRWWYETKERLVANDLARAEAATTAEREQAAIIQLRLGHELEARIQAEQQIATLNQERCAARREAQREREVRGEAEQRLQALEDELTDARRAIEQLRRNKLAELIDAQMNELAEVKASFDQEVERREKAERELAVREAEATEARQACDREAAQRQQAELRLLALVGSTTWRASATARRVLNKVPAPTRHKLRTILSRISALIRQGRTKDLTLIKNSELFNEAWYLAQNPDVAAAGMGAAEHYLRVGWKEGRSPGPHFSGAAYLAANADVAAAGINPFVHWLQSGRAEGRSGAQPPGVLSFREPQPGQPSAPRYARVDEPPLSCDLAAARWPGLRPLRFFPVPDPTPRLSIVTDSVGPSALFGGVGTSMLLGTLLANRMGANLRLITRNEPPDASAFRQVLGANGISLAGKFEIAFAPLAGGSDLPLGKQDRFLSTSWWTTRALLDSVERDRVAYLLQEDERMFYPHGDERLRCAETLREPGIAIAVNTEMLYRHLTSGPANLPNLLTDGVWFEPAFPDSIRAAGPARGKRKFFFYARPNNYRNLFWRGIEVLSAAIAQGVFDAASWEFYFVGRDWPDMRLPGGVIPVRTGGLDWKAYHELVAGMDAGLVLMDTPHPSYPPLDLAAAGVPVLTNTHPGKNDLSCYSKNILVAEPDTPSLLEGLVELVRLRDDKATRLANREQDNISRDWARSLAPAVELLAARLSPKAPLSPRFDG